MLVGSDWEHELDVRANAMPAPMAAGMARRASVRSPCILRTGSFLGRGRTALQPPVVISEAPPENRIEINSHVIMTQTRKCSCVWLSLMDLTAEWPQRSLPNFEEEPCQGSLLAKHSLMYGSTLEVAKRCTLNRWGLCLKAVFFRGLPLQTFCLTHGDFKRYFAGLTLSRSSWMDIGQ